MSRKHRAQRQLALLVPHGNCQLGCRTEKPDCAHAVSTCLAFCIVRIKHHNMISVRHGGTYLFKIEPLENWWMRHEPTKTCEKVLRVLRHNLPSSTTAWWGISRRCGYHKIKALLRDEFRMHIHFGTIQKTYEYRNGIWNPEYKVPRRHYRNGTWYGDHHQ